MIEASIKDLKAILTTIDFELGAFSGDFKGVITDSREVFEGCCFLCIKGENFDAHDFIEDAILNGATVIIGQNSSLKSDANNLKELLETYSKVKIIGVEDTIKSLGELAKWWRMNFEAPVFFITGSSGKTSTKQLLSKVLEKTIGKGTASIKSFNNHIGLPLTILRANRDDKWLVLEAGMNHAGEIDYLSMLSSPDAAIVTSIGTAHIGNLGSVENIAKAKLELISNLRCDSTLVLNADNEYLLNYRSYCPTVRPEGLEIKWFGQSDGVQMKISNIEILENEEGYITQFKLGEVDVEIKLLGAHHAYNSAAAILVAKSVFPEISLKDATKALLEAENEGMRFDIIEIGRKCFLINDAYNANPSSVRASVQTFMAMKKFDKRCLVIGYMGELGRFSKELHLELGEWLCATDLNMILAVGEYAEELICEVKENNLIEAHSFSDNKSLTEFLIKNINEQQTDSLGILFKGSRTEGLEKVVGDIKNNISN